MMANSDGPEGISTGREPATQKRPCGVVRLMVAQRRLYLMETASDMLRSMRAFTPLPNPPPLQLFRMSSMACLYQQSSPFLHELGTLFHHSWHQPPQP